MIKCTVTSMDQMLPTLQLPSYKTNERNGLCLTYLNNVGMMFAETVRECGRGLRDIQTRHCVITENNYCPTKECPTCDRPVRRSDQIQITSQKSNNKCDAVFKVVFASHDCSSEQPRLKYLIYGVSNIADSPTGRTVSQFRIMYHIGCPPSAHGGSQSNAERRPVLCPDSVTAVRTAGSDRAGKTENQRTFIVDTSALSRLRVSSISLGLAPGSTYIKWTEVAVMNTDSRKYPDIAVVHTGRCPGPTPHLFYISGSAFGVRVIIAACYVILQTDQPP